jgi:DNA-binding transcriptional LysR family regulator
MNLNHLALFRAVAQEGSFTRGAERAYVSQPAVSKQVSELERALGTVLFERIPRGVRLTEAGELLLGYAQRLFALEADAERALAELRGLERGHLRLGASLTIGAYVLPELLGEFHRRYPGVALSVEIANTEAVEHMILEGHVDLGLTEGFWESEELVATTFQEDTLVVIAPPTHPLLAQSPLTAERLCAEPLILREHGSGTRAVAERAFAARGLTLLALMSLGSIEAIKRAVAAGIGLAIVSGLTLDLELAAGRLAVLPLADLVMQRPLHLLFRRSASESRATRAFRELLTQT